MKLCFLTTLYTLYIYYICAHEHTCTHKADQLRGEQSIEDTGSVLVSKVGSIFLKEKAFETLHIGAHLCVCTQVHTYKHICTHTHLVERVQGDLKRCHPSCSSGSLSLCMAVLHLSKAFLGW